MKSFWESNGYRFTDILNLQLPEIVSLMNCMSREDLIAWLSWNDPNGIYEDIHSIKELNRIMTREEGMEIMLRQIEDNRV